MTFIRVSDNTDLHALVALDTLKEGGDGKVDSLFVVHVIFNFLFKVLSVFLAIFAAGVGFPFLVGTRRFSLEESRLSFPEASEEARDTVGTDTTFLSRFLLNLSDHTGNILYIGGIFVPEPETLALKTSLVNQNTSISLESGESHGEMVINFLNFMDSFRVL